MTALSWQVVTGIAGIFVVFWLLPAGWRWHFLNGITLAVLGYMSPASLGLLLVVSFGAYAILQFRPSHIWYWVFSLTVFFSWLGLRATSGNGWAWFGAAFYVLRAIHVVLEQPRTADESPSLSDFAAYMLFSPIIAVGPVDRFPSFLREKQRVRWNPILVSAGLETILYGYAQIVILANYLFDVRLHSEIMQLAAGPWRAWLECFHYGGALYFKFSGYSDIAIGFALLLGIRVQENFRHPYLATNIADFWRRWHISVTSWCRDYVNMPVLAATRSRGIAALASMLTLGVWHELSLRYILWGAFHGTGIMIWLQWRKLRDTLVAPSGLAGKLELGAAWAVTMVFVIASFAITKEATIEGSLRALGALVGWRIG